MTNRSRIRAHAARGLAGLILASQIGACMQVPAELENPPTSALAAVARGLGTQQCGEQGARAAAELLAAPLRAAGIQVQALRCGHDGRMRPQMCGAPDGRLVVVDVPVHQREAARTLGFAPLSQWPDARSLPCR